MKKLLALMFSVLSFVGMAQSDGEFFYNPDSDGDGFISVTDLTSFLSTYGSPFDSNVCPCGGCEATPDWVFPEAGDTLTAAEVAAHLFTSAPDSIFIQLYISPYGEGYLPFLGDTTLSYEQRGIYRSIPWFLTRTSDPARMLFAENAPLCCGSVYYSFQANMYAQSASSYPSSVVNNYDSPALSGGALLLQDGPEPIDFNIDLVCPEIGNSEFWEILDTTSFVQVDEGMFINLYQSPSHITPSHDDPANAEWVFHYPLDWVILSTQPITIDPDQE